MPVEIGGMDEPAQIALSLTIAEDRISADFTGTSPQVRRPVNSPMNYTRAYVAVPLKMICDPELPNNEGTYRPLDISAPPGTLINPSYPAACFWRLASGMLVSELVFRILAEIAPERVPADSGSMPTWQFYVSGLHRNGEAWALHQHAFGGMGGRPGADGLAAVSFPYNVRNVSVEWSETETPVLFLRRELIADSGGAGPMARRARRGAGVHGGGECRCRAGIAAGPVRLGRPDPLSGARRARRRARQSRLRSRVNDEPIAPTSAPDVHFKARRCRTPQDAGRRRPRQSRRTVHLRPSKATCATVTSRDCRPAHAPDQADAQHADRNRHRRHFHGRGGVWPDGHQRGQGASNRADPVAAVEAGIAAIAAAGGHRPAPR